MKKKPTPPAAPAAPVIVASFTLPAATLKSALARLKPAVGARMAHPSFSSILIARKDGATSLAASDATHYAVHRIASAFPPPTSELSRKLSAARFARENCLLLLPFADLVEVARDCDRLGEITLTAFDGSTVELAYPVNGVTIRREISRIDPEELTVPAAEFPPDAPKITFDAAGRNSFFRALDACSTDETRPVLNGVALDASQPGHHAAIGTDGSQLIFANGIHLPFESLVIVPNSPVLAGKFLRDLPWSLEFAFPKPRKHDRPRIAKAIAKIDKKLEHFYSHATADEGAQFTEEEHSRIGTLERRKGRLELYRDTTDATRLRLTCDGTIYEFLAIEGNYPNYRQVIPNEDSYRLTVPFGPAVRSHVLSILPKLEHNRAEKLVCVEVLIDKASVSLAAGKTIVNLPTTPRWKGDKPDTMRLSVQRRFLLSAAAQGFDELHLISDKDPFVFHAGTSRYVAMPTGRKEAN